MRPGITWIIAKSSSKFLQSLTFHSQTHGRIVTVQGLVFASHGVLFALFLILKWKATTYTYARVDFYGSVNSTGYCSTASEYTHYFKYTLSSGYICEVLAVRLAAAEAFKSY